ncbi:hypothetical protein [Treponema phagedenis]|uniref:hypothetical protein n=1 Tax=Treponema phagedenis TaxID=162 RepID=UPI0001F63ECE|nr:hypothetical protein [Treponema phagedenis]EFW37765.1 hypothetical protein HMPREF9554_01768 [Treponema phagedenis F0421]NVP24638.1 hypothetical protein [Treponema phagedenis]QKS91902.1 hypothetical protein HPJ96_04545 [Treponema phagedenis]QLC58835.1 hypothetical protein HW453_08470 [Treponema phagedenis]TYT79414.1 hypothetical protein FS559_10150 [Treponema phagedenis]
MSRTVKSEQARIALSKKTLCQKSAGYIVDNWKRIEKRGMDGYESLCYSFMKKLIAETDTPQSV